MLSCDPLQANFEVLPRVLFNTYAHGVSRDGQIVAGWTENSASGRPVLWDELGNRQLLPFTDPEMHAFEISDPDPVTGARIVTGTGANYVRWVDGVLEDTGIQAPGAGISIAAPQFEEPVGATPDGQIIVGSEEAAAGQGGPFVLDVPTGVLQRLPEPTPGSGTAHDMSDDGATVVGNVRVPSVCNWGPCTVEAPAVWQDGVLQLLPGGTPCSFGHDVGRALAGSADGSVVVGRVLTCSSQPSIVRNSAVWRDGRLIELPMDLPSPTGQGANSPAAIGVSPNGRYVVGTQNRFAGPAFIWDEQSGLRDLSVVLARDYGLTAEMAAWSLAAATDVTTLPDGSIVVVGYMWPSAASNPSSFHGFRVTLEATCPDDDLDGLCNEWEEQQYVDVNCNGVKETPGTDLELKDADPQHKNIYVEIDYIEDTTMPSGVIADVERAFARVPNNLIGNPNGEAGILLELDESDPSLPKPVAITFPLRYGWSNSTACGMPDQFAVLKDGWFGTSQEQGSPELLAVKRRLFRYMIIGSGFDDTNVIGQATWFGPNAVVAEDALESRELAAATIMHELGHTLGLGHGGPRDIVNYKPNYHSVMNYTWTRPAAITLHPDDKLGKKAYAASWRLDFARTAFSFELDEAAGLDETRGLGGPLAHTLHVVPVGPLQGTPQFPLALPKVHFEAGEIDFDRDGAIETLSDPANVNNVNTSDSRPFAEIQKLELLVPRADWPFVAENLAASFEHPNWTISEQGSCVGLLLGPGDIDAIREPTLAELRGLGVDMPIDCNQNGVEDTDDLLAGTSTDADGDFILDECEPLPGDCDGDADVDDADRTLFISAFGRTEGEPEFLACADLDRDRDVTLVDYQAWIAAHQANQASAQGCGGLGGGEAALLFGAWAWQRRGAHRRRRAPTLRRDAS